MSTTGGGICRNQKVNATPGEYELKVASADSNVTLQGFHGINGKRQSTWMNSDLFNTSQKFNVQAPDRHQTVVTATFTPAAGAASKVTVTIRRANEDVMTCELKPGERTTSSLSILTPLA